MHSLSRRAAPLHAAQPSCYDMNSPLLFGALAALGEDARVEVLDLTPAHAGLLEYFTRYHCKLFLPASRTALCQVPASEPEEIEKIPRVLKRLVPIYKQDKAQLDLLLLWDLPNYLNRHVLTGLIAHLLPHLSRHAVLHTYIHTRQSMPQQPGKFSLGSEGKVRVDLSAQWNTPSPMYYQEILHKLLDPFRVQRGMLLANGLQEYVLRRQ